MRRRGEIGGIEKKSSSDHTGGSPPQGKAPRRGGVQGRSPWYQFQGAVNTVTQNRRLRENMWQGLRLALRAVSTMRVVSNKKGARTGGASERDVCRYDLMTLPLGNTTLLYQTCHGHRSGKWRAYTEVRWISYGTIAPP